MKFLPYVFAVLVAFSCKSNKEESPIQAEESMINRPYTMVFASCSDQDREQPLWQPILQNEPDLFVWGGDNIYADTEDMAKMKRDYDKVWAHPDYKRLAENTAITGTWDDHDFGKNDAGTEWGYKEEAKKLMLDFLKVSNEDPRRHRAGVYTSEVYGDENGSVKLILLDTRSFRDGLKKSEDPDLRYDAWEGDEGGTILGEAQWKWLELELEDDTADFTVIVTSIQFLNDRHGWEKWGNHPSEVQKMNELLEGANAKNILMFSGDRHMAEISVAEIEGLEYALVDFTSSGLTHTWIDGATEGNEYRVSNVIKQLNFGVILFDFEKSEVTFEIRGRDNFLYEQYVQQY
ncbi:MAG: alkaline phosphatase D family protein [Bacteroidota bacterium]